MTTLVLAALLLAQHPHAAHRPRQHVPAYCGIFFHSSTGDALCDRRTNRPYFWRQR